ncbi:ABC transporter ATP-binding protein [Planomonospora venezuelensis]|uniref:ATP-binding cassette subfamily B protein n=1 Tax=Planomonospora venezuelensis TaxID=1999 RepID=A0A841DDX9_PLAVE|nr:ABC transporter ATP-binding protein [Planomonospora venezuelensis]MBB5966498.1 ATP-binding cassette subfamily B protein [Planomonospora venezuelensis]GIN02323.1 ABC transporter ATP-binding protein [Planomonospora venezuelensis]
MPDPVPGPSRERVTRKHGDRLLVSLARGPRVPLAVVAAASLASSAAVLLLPAVLASAVDEALTGRGPRTAAVCLILVLALTACAEIAGMVAGAAATASATSSLRVRLTAHLLSLDIAETRRSPTGELVNRLVSNTATAGRVPVTLVGIATGLITSIGGVAALFVIDWRVGLTFVAGAPAAVALIRLFVERVSGLYDDYQGAQGRLAARLTDALAGIRTVRASGSADREITRILAPLPELSGSGHALWRAQARSVWKIALLLPLIEVAVLGTAGLGVADGRLEPGQLLAAAGYTALGLSFVDQTDALMALAHSRSAARRICEVLGLPVPPAGTRPPAEGPGALSFRGVTVVRENTAPVEDVDLEVPAGSLTAVVGRSGAGKSTLALLAGRLTDPDRGEVLLDGRPLREIEPDALRGAVAYAFERPVLLGGDLAEAVSYGLPAVDREAVREAARAAHVDDVIGRLPEGYGTPAGTAPLSGGELQRLGLARALVRRARLTVLDDATSGLDTATEAQVTRTLLEGMRGRTRLVVAHRVATAARADLVVWMEDGRIRARGTHRGLWRDPDYRALFAAAGEVSPQDQEDPCPARS